MPRATSDNKEMDISWSDLTAPAPTLCATLIQVPFSHCNLVGPSPSCMRHQSNLIIQPTPFALLAASYPVHDRKPVKATGPLIAMDTSQLAQQVTSIIGQLHTIFDEIGVQQHEREARESELFTSLSETLYNHLRQVSTYDLQFT